MNSSCRLASYTGKSLGGHHASSSQMLRGCYMWWMESLTSSRSGMMAWHLSEVLCSHCDQILLCSCFIVVTAWGMLGFVLPTVAIHHLWRKKKRAQWHFAFHFQHTHLSLHTPLTFALLRHPVFATAHSAPSFPSARVLLNHPSCFSHTPHSIARGLSLWAMWKDRRGGLCCSSIQKHLARKHNLPFPNQSAT